MINNISFPNIKPSKRIQRARKAAIVGSVAAMGAGVAIGGYALAKKGKLGTKMQDLVNNLSKKIKDIKFNLPSKETVTVESNIEKPMQNSNIENLTAVKKKSPRQQKFDLAKKELREAREKYTNSTNPEEQAILKAKEANYVNATFDYLKNWTDDVE